LLEYQRTIPGAKGPLILTGMFIRGAVLHGIPGLCFELLEDIAGRNPCCASFSLAIYKSLISAAIVVVDMDIMSAGHERAYLRRIIVLHSDHRRKFLHIARCQCFGYLRTNSVPDLLDNLNLVPRENVITRETLRCCKLVRF